MFTQKDRLKCEQLYQKYYAGRTFAGTLYRELIRGSVQTGARVLDAGCGRYLEFSRELPADVNVVGIDLEPNLATTNQGSPFGVRADLDHLPFPSEYFDLIISRSVVEHLANPRAVFREFERVIKPGGRVILSTPNKYDYVSIIAAMTPYRWHRLLVNKIIGLPEDDVFPTFYRANTILSLCRELRKAGFGDGRVHAVNHYPVYLMFSPLLFHLGVLYERLTSLQGLWFLRGSLIAVFEKPGASRTQNRATQPNATRDPIELTSVGA